VHTKWGDFTVRYERKSESYRINGKSNPSEKKVASTELIYCPAKYSPYTLIYPSHSLIIQDVNILNAHATELFAILFLIV
jgi:hypothetical protein